MSEFASAPPDVPAPSAALVLWRLSIEALIATLPRKKSERFLRVMTEKLAGEESMAQVLHIRPSARRSDVARARTEAVELYERCLPLFLAMLPDE